ncbi:hypothetical protein MPH_04642 [Macrophomina phaseolina MS6]|uniref:Rhodopsin domain-containing protein n=1 Tax=Macrophomina phaseolina (strain MS6) TaxID=1126212 RepID=K2SMX2_MACPH|nr:hypothetical protein MPH_04642 [Macrophomina phaseolina MS6]
MDNRRHSADLSPEILVPTLKHWYAYQMVYPFALFFIKASILALYYKVFSQRVFRIWISITAAVVAAHTVVAVFVNAFECRHRISDAWSPTFPKGCNNLPKTYFSTAGVSIATDFILLWSQVECNIAIVTACIPPLRPMFKETFRDNSSSRSRKDSGSKSTGGIFSGTPRFRAQGLVELDAYRGSHSEWRNTVSSGADNESEKHILSSEQIGIRKTMCVETVSSPVEE